MKHNKLMKTAIAAALLLCTGMFSSCSEDVDLNRMDEGGLDKINGVYGYVRNSDYPKMKVIEMRKQTVTTQIYAGLSKAMSQALDATVTVDQALLDAYNLKNQTSYAMLPTERYSLEEEGAILIAPGEVKSDPVTITVTPGTGLSDGTTYALPLSVEFKNPELKASKDDNGQIILIKAMGAIPSTDKGTGIITICYVECNNNNPLNAKEWRLTRSGKPMMDIVNIFAANINYIEETGRIGVRINSNVQHILNNRDKYIKPLQDIGIKVCLTIMGNHDGTGVSNLSDATAREFAAEVKSIINTYGLDGVDFDDEWSDYSKYPMRPGCVERGAYPYARLCYEMKQAMPDKLCTVYSIGPIIPESEESINQGFNMMIGGMKAGDFVDYSYCAQYGQLDLETWKSVLGMEKRQWGPASIDLTGWEAGWNLPAVRNGGYGVQVVYDLCATDKDANTMRNYQNTFDLIAQQLYRDAGATFSGVNHHVDW